MSNSNVSVDEITLEELARLIRILGMLGSAADGEVLAAARHAVRWVKDKRTSWEVLLTPLEEPPAVSGVVTASDPDGMKAREDAAYRRGMEAGLKAQAAANARAAQVKAQAAAQAPMGGSGSAWTASGLGPGGTGGAAAQGPVAAPGGSGGGNWGQGTWQWVAQALLDRDAQGIPGVFRGSREQQFVADVLARGFRTLTPGQEKWLRDIAGRSGMNW